MSAAVTLRRFGPLTVLVPALLWAACGGSPTSPAGTSAAIPAPAPTTGFTLQGDPTTVLGASWTYRGTVGGTAVDLQGILLKPAGAGPFPAVVISHGAGGSASGYSRSAATQMVGWGLVCIATNYTHAGPGVAAGAPGTSMEPGASEANVTRAHATYEILRTLGYVDMGRVAAHGHSMGAYVTSALLGAYPQDFRVGSHTAGGVRSPAAGSGSGLGGGTGAAPTEAQVATIRAPYQLHHGDADVTVTLAQAQRLAEVLRERAVVHELLIYPGAGHNDVAFSPTVLGRIRAWYAAHGMF